MASSNITITVNQTATAADGSSTSTTATVAIPLDGGKVGAGLAGADAGGGGRGGPLRVMMINSLATGHFNPARRLVKALTSPTNGVAIEYLTPVEKQIAELGVIGNGLATAHPYFPDEVVDGKKWFAADAPNDGAWYNSGYQVWEFGKRSPEAAKRTITWLKWLCARATELKVDVIIGEQHAPWGKVVAKATGLPYVTMCPMKTWNEEDCTKQVISEMDENPASVWHNPIVLYVRDTLDADEKTSGDAALYHNLLLNKMEDVIIKTDLFKLTKDTFGMGMTYKDTGWADEDAASFMGGYSKYNVQFSGPVFADQPTNTDGWFNDVEIAAIGPNVGGASTRALSPKVQDIMDAVEAATDATPVVYVAFGTCDAPADSVFRMIIEDLCAEGTNFLLVVKYSGSKDPQEFYQYAARKDACLITNEFLPQADILQHTNMFISHCGMGGLNEACIHGVPVLLFPTDPERFGNAKIMARRELGVFVLDELAALTNACPRLNWWVDYAANTLKPGQVKAKATALWSRYTTDDAFRANVVATSESMLPSAMAGVLHQAVETIVAMKGTGYRG